MSPTVKTLLVSLAIIVMPAFGQTTPVTWSNLTHQPHYADINGDGHKDLLLQAIDHTQQSSWIAAIQSTEGYIQYNQSQQQPLALDLVNAKLQLADFNGDGLADLLVRQPQNAVTYFASAQGFNLANPLNHPTADWLISPTDFNSVSGDFNGDGFDDLLLLSVTGERHQLLHSNNQGQLTVVQSINQNVKWGKVNRDKLLVGDFNNDGKADLFAWAKKQGKSHYVVYADEAGKLKPANTNKIKAKITDVDWANRNLTEYLEV